MPPVENNTIDLNTFHQTAVGNGRLDQSLTNALYGLNPTHTEQILHSDTKHKVHVFFTRPQLNLTHMNCILNTELMKLLTDNKNSIHRYTRCALDPRLFYSTDKVQSDLLDPYNPFIPILSNTVTKVSGWPDVVMATRTSKPGHLKEETGIADGTVEILNSFNLDITFRHILQEPITTIFNTWLTYMDKVHKGHIMPYIDMILRREIDYMTRIYIIVTDESNNTIKKIANIGAGFPVSSPMGMFFDYDKSDLKNQTVSDINIQFKCFGAEYNKHNSMLDFNTLVAAFHPKMKQLHKGNPNSGMMQVYDDVMGLFKHRVYPYIDLGTNRLLWYIDEEYVKIIDDNEGRDL